VKAFGRFCSTLVRAAVNDGVGCPQDDAVPRKEKRQYKKRKHKGGSSSVGGSSVSRNVLDSYHLAQSSEEESSSGLHPGGSPHPAPEEDEDEGPFAFRRNPACNYHAVSAKLVLFKHSRGS